MHWLPRSEGSSEEGKFKHAGTLATCSNYVISVSIAIVPLVVLLDHPVAPALVAPLHETVEEAKGVDESQVVLQVVDQRAIGLPLPSKLNCYSMMS